MTLTIELDAKSEEILTRLKGEMTPSAFFKLLLQMVDSQAVGAPLPVTKKKELDGAAGQDS
jgi:hypothetical protein